MRFAFCERSTPGFDAILKSAWLTYLAIEVQRWILVLAAGVFLCFSPAIMGLEDDAPLDLFPIEDVSIQDTIAPVVVPAAKIDLLDEAPMTYWEAVLPSLVVLVVLCVACHLLSRFANLKPQDRSNRALAIEQQRRFDLLRARNSSRGDSPFHSGCSSSIPSWRRLCTIADTRY